MAVPALLTAQAPVDDGADKVVPAGAVVATVDGEVIAADAVRRAMLRHAADIGRASEARDAAIEELVRTGVLARAAEQAGLTEDPEVREAIRNLLAQRYWKRLVDDVDVPPVTEEEARAVYEEQLQRFTEPVRFRGSILTLRHSDASTDPEQVWAKALALRERAADGDATLFARLVREHSEDPITRRRDGDLGFVVEGGSVFRWEPEVIDALFALEQPGDLSPVIVTERNVHLVLLTERQGGEPLEFEVVEGEIRRGLFEARRAEALDQVWSDLKGRFEVEIDRQVLERIGPPEMASPTRPPSFPVGGGR